MVILLIPLQLVHMCREPSFFGTKIMLGFGVNNKNLLPIEPRIAQIYLSSNDVSS
jgi:hypothetical protein